MVVNPLRVARWVIENDPSWEKALDPNPSVLRWTKKGTGIQAVGSATSIFCDIEGGNDTNPTLPDPLKLNVQPRGSAHEMMGDISKYLSSRYLNSNLGQDAYRGPRRVSRF